MGMGGGQGTTTSTVNNVPWNAGNLSNIQNNAVNLMNDPNARGYYPGQTYAGPNTNTVSGLQNASNYGIQTGMATAPLTADAQTTALGANTNIAGGSGLEGAQPWLTALSAAGGANPAQASIDALFGVGTGSAAQNLDYTASGGYMNNNPYLSKQYAAMTDPLVRQFQTATSPRTDSTMNAAGRFQSGGLANAQSTNEANLGNVLGDAASNLYGTDYAKERDRMVSAASSLGNLQNTAYGTAGQLGVSGQNTATSANATALDAYNRLLAGQQSAINSTPALSGMYSTDLQSGINAGTQLTALDQAQLSDQIARFYGNQQAPWNAVSQAANIVGGAIPGLQTSTQPYFKPSPLAEIAGIGSSVAGIGKALMK